MIVTGLERLLSESAWRRYVEGRRVGLLVNPTSVDRRLRHAVDLALEAGWDVRRLYGPEHGVRGEAQDMEAVDEDRDPISGLRRLIAERLILVVIAPERDADRDDWSDPEPSDRDRSDHLILDAVDLIRVSREAA